MNSFPPEDFFYMPPQLKPFVDLMGENAFQLLSPQDKSRTFMFIPQRGSAQLKTLVVFNLRRVEQGEQKVTSQISYITHDQPIFFHSPLFSPNGKNVLTQDGYPPGDIDYAATFCMWEQNTGGLRPLQTQATRLNRILWSPGSRFLSYTHGGQVYRAPGVDENEPYELWCLDVPSGREHLVIKDPGFDWSWTYHGQILCSTTALPAKSSTPYQPYSRIYEVNATGGNPRKVFERGFLPCESPDGRWIAFYDWPDAWYQFDPTLEAARDALKPRLCLFDRKTRKRQWIKEVDARAENYGYRKYAALQMQWALDGRSLYVLASSTNSQQEPTATLYCLDGKSHALSLLATLKSEEAPYTFRFRGISSDNAQLYIECISAAPNTLQGDTQFIRLSTLYSVKTRTSEQRALARVFDVAGINVAWDFRDNVPLNSTLVAAEKLENSLPLPSTVKKVSKPIVHTRPRQKSKNSRR